MQASDLQFNELGNVTGIGRLLGEPSTATGPKAPPAPAAQPMPPAATRLRDPYAGLDRRWATPAGQALLKGGLWLRAAFIGASLVLMGVVTLADSSAGPLYGVLMIALGAPLGWFAYRRAGAAIERADAAAGTKPAA